MRRHISIDLEFDLGQQLRHAAEHRGVTVRQYILEALETRLREDIRDHGEHTTALTAWTDPVLADLWDNDHDAAYDRL